MSRAVKKLSTFSHLEQYEAEFNDVKIVAANFEQHDEKGRSLLNEALVQIFNFGEAIRTDMVVFEQFLNAHDMKMNKVTEDNPYNALIALAFSDRCEKSWRSQLSNVLAYASKKIGKEPIADWLQRRTLTAWYAEAVKYFKRTATTKAQKLRSSRLAMIESELKSAPIVTEPLSGVKLADGFHRSFVYSEGGKAYLVHINDDDAPNIIEKYLLEIAENKSTPDHPLAGRPLYPLFRAIDLIVTTCKPSSDGDAQLIAIWNETLYDRKITKLRFLSNAYSFTNATITLGEAIPELDGKGQLALDLVTAETFCNEFQDDHQWKLTDENAGTFLVDNAKPRIRLQLKSIASYNDKRLRQGKKLGRKTRHFQATCAGMQASASNLETARELFKKANRSRLSSAPTPRRLQWLASATSLEVGFAADTGYAGLRYPFLDFLEPVSALVEHRELAVTDIAALWKAAAPYGEDLSGHVADSDDEDDAAFCIDHTFIDGDRFEYACPMVIGISMDRTHICEDFEPSPPPAPGPSGPAPSTPSGSPQSFNGPSSAPERSRKRVANAPNGASSLKPRNYERVEKNRQQKRSMFPASPSLSGRAFGAFVTSYLPEEAAHKKSRMLDLSWQLEWWRRMTDIPVHVVASNWTDDDIAGVSELGRLTERGGRILRQPARSIAENRNLCLSELYASDFDWGIVMDDDAVLGAKSNHGSSYRLFAEMAANGKSAYEGIDLFQPIFGRQVPFNKKYQADGNLYADNHVFERSTNLKGTMVVVRNFVKEGREPLFLPTDFEFVGEDTYLTCEAISHGYAPMTCWNIVLEELGGESFFAMSDAERTEKMRQGHERLVEIFGQHGLRMSDDGTHKLKKNDFINKFWGEKKRSIAVPKAHPSNASEI